MFELKTPVIKLNRVGKNIAQQIKKLGIETVDDLITHYPSRYDDYSEILSIEDFKNKKNGTIKTKINLIANHRSFKKNMIITEAIVSDETDSLRVVWFNQPFLAKNLKTGQTIYLAGKISEDNQYGLQMTNPSYETVSDDLTHTGRLVPIYPSTAKLTQKQIRFLIRQIIPVTHLIEDWLPRKIKTKYNLTDLSFALEQIHFPSDKNWLQRAVHRLKFDELFLIQARNQIVRKKMKQKESLVIKFQEKETKKFVDQLPFKLTNAQRKSAWEIINDLGKGTPMNRLLEGEVGSGKTVVALIAILNVILNKYQSAYMAPTEILAEQHFNNIVKLFKKRPFKIALFTRGIKKINVKNEKDGKKISKAEMIKLIISGKIDLVIGTHSLIQENVKFKKLGLVIIDEQHRFGVKQRADLGKKSNLENNYLPHFLSMTATPIPRSLALSLYGDLDISIIDQLPIGRKKIITKIIDAKKSSLTYNFVKNEIKKGRQVFVICPLIDPSDKLGVKSVKEEFQKLSQNVFPKFTIAILHGKMKVNEKEEAMKNFLANKINILVSTTVVEVGVDVPNASVMIIEGAERFGLAQLYQLRGRIGRSNHQSYCFLMDDNDDFSKKNIVQQRLKALLEAKNGFELAEKDLTLRGPGEMFNTKQAGISTDLKIARLSDFKIIKETKQAAEEMFKIDFNIENYPLLDKKINDLFLIDHLE